MNDGRSLLKKIREDSVDIENSFSKNHDAFINICRQLSDVARQENLQFLYSKKACAYDLIINMKSGAAVTASVIVMPDGLYSQKETYAAYQRELIELSPDGILRLLITQALPKGEK